MARSSRLVGLLWWAAALLLYPVMVVAPSVAIAIGLPGAIIWLLIVVLFGATVYAVGSTQAPRGLWLLPVFVFMAFGAWALVFELPLLARTPTLSVSPEYVIAQVAIVLFCAAFGSTIGSVAARRRLSAKSVAPAVGSSSDGLT